MSESTFLYALIGGSLPSFIWLIFWLREDSQNPEPHWLIVLTFLGGFLAVIAAYFGEKYVAEIVVNKNMQYICWAAIEEVLKFSVVAIIALNSDYNDEPLDAMIYCIVAALGFAALENTLFLYTPLSSGVMTTSIITGDMRFIGATLVHIVSSATVGAFIGYCFYRGYFSKFLALILGLGAAIAFHAAFNIAIVNVSGTEVMNVFTWIWAGVVLLIVFFEELKAVGPRSL